MRVSQADLRAAETNASALRVAHYVDGAWVVRNTTVLDQTADEVTIEFTTDGFSPFAVTAIEPLEANVTNLPATERATPVPTTETLEPDTRTTTSADGPGFGVLAAVTALLGSALLARRHRAR
jgi:PGF-CTERM protein